MLGSKCITTENIYHGLKEMEHVLRGPLQVRVEEIEKELEQFPYYLDEATNWSITMSELETAIRDKTDDCKPRAFVVINPGNPTSQVLTQKIIEEVIKFAYKENLFLLADEGYQQNIYDPTSEFVSFKKVLMEMGATYNEMELASFMSSSKGFMGECGLRGGYVEMINLDPDVRVHWMYGSFTLFKHHWTGFMGECGLRGG